ncbi:pyocin knob domain-containing protein, partial [Leuconostoc citreum]
ADSATIGVVQNDISSLKGQVYWQEVNNFDDMNYFRGTGNFLITGGAHINAPVQGWFYITVESPRTDRTTQTAWQDQDNGLVYRRVFDGTNWSTWSQVVSSSTLLNIFHDSWSLGTSTNDGITKQLITGINGQADGTLVLSGKSVILNSDTVIGRNFIIGSANIANGAIGTAQIGEAAITSAKIANLDVSKLTGDTITGFNINANRQIKIASGGALISDVVNMDKTNFSVSAPNISSYRFSSEKYKVSTSNGIFNINSVLGVFSSDGNISVAVDTNTDPYKKGVFHSEYGGNNLMMSATNYTNGDPDEQLNMSSARLDYMYSKTGFLSDATDHTSIRANLIETTGTLNAFSGAQIPNIYSYPNLILESKNQSVYFRSGGDYRLQIRENGYIYLWNKKFGSGGSSLQVAGDGALFIQSSATKFKEDIQYDGGTSVGDKFLTLDPATWQDKSEYEARAEYRKIGTEPDHQIHMDDKRYYGLIAEDLVKAGLEEFVVRDENTGEVNGLEYDKVAISMIPVIRSQRDAINELKAEVERLKDKVK